MASAVLQPAAAALVEAKRGVDQRAPVREQPADAIVVAPFFVSRQGDDEIARGDETLLPHENEVRDPDGGHGLVVRGAAAVVEAVALEKRERIERPILGVRVDHIEVREQKNRLGASRATQARHQVTLLGMRSDNVHVLFGKAGIEESACHRLGRLGRVTRRIGRVDLDELFQDVAGERTFGRELGLAHERRRGDNAP